MFKSKQDYLDQRKALLVEAEQLLDEGKIDEYEAKEKEIKDLDEQYEKFAKAQANINALRDKTPSQSSIIVDQKPDKEIEPEDPFNTLEYRKAFMNFAKTGKMPAQFMNADQTTTTSDASAVIPTTIMQEIIQKMEEYGQIFSRVRKTNIRGGVEVPILSLKPTATWIGETTVSDRQKVTINTKVQFSYHGLECRIATSLLADITTLDIFERTITELIVEAMIKALDKAIISGTGSGQPLGIVNDNRIPAGNIVTLSSTDIGKWDAWKKKVFAKIPLAYRAGGAFIMAAGTFEGYIDGMTDANGQPIGRINYGITNGPQERFGGREVLLVEDDVIAPYEAASEGDVVAVFCKLSDYVINSNMRMTMYRWMDHDRNEWVDKAILVADGKILDPNGVIIIKKGA